MKKQKDELQTYEEDLVREKRPGPGSAGQSGDTQGLSDVAEAGGQSVLELVEEGQNFEAEVVLGMEEASELDVAPIRTKQVPEDDVPWEYTDQERQERGKP